MNCFLRKLFLSRLMLSCILLLSSQVNATINFSNRSAAIKLRTSNSDMRIGKASAVTGWTQESIVKSFGNNASNLWTEAYSDGDRVSQTGSKKPATNLLYSTSNAIVNGNSGGSTSNSIAYLSLRVRNDSNLLFKLNRDSSNSIRSLSYKEKNDSNSIAWLANNVDESTSNSIAWLDLRVKTNSNYTVRKFY